MLNHQRSQQVALVATQAVREGSAFLRNLILARLLGAEEMGLAVALTLGIRLFEMVGDLGLDKLLVQVEEVTLASMRRMVHLLQLLKGFVQAALVFALATLIAPVLNPDLDPSLFILAAVGLAIRGASNFDFRECQRDGNFMKALIVEGGSAFSTVLVCAPLAWVIRDHSVLAWGLLVQSIVYFALSHLVATSDYRLGFERALLARCLGYGAPIAFNGALVFLALQGDRLVVALNFSAAELAGFALAAQLTLLPALIAGRYLLAHELPIFARLSRNAEGVGGHCLLLLRRITPLSLAGVLAFGVGGNALVGWLYGEAFMVAAPVFWALAAGAGIRVIRSVPGTMLMALERTQYLIISNLPRLVTLPLALWSAMHGGSLATVVAIGVIGEALSLLVAFGAIALSGGMIMRRSTRQLVEGF